MTYSIAARCPQTNAFGIAITSSSICVASRCAWMSPHGAVLTQNITDPQLGVLGLALLKQGMGAPGVLAALTASTRHAAFRQLAVVDRYGETAHHSGGNATPQVGQAAGPNCVAIGNILADASVPAAMIDAFGSSADREFPERLLVALEAGLNAGGETKDERSAGLEIYRHFTWPVVDLRVDWHEDPIGELRRTWTEYEKQLPDYLARALDPAAAPGF
ncbi:MAG: DUF1028 domain-containing protein [Alphaproteobacteria bacterium]|nr:DUF1028 domain-containing protein [Alphaproteobacteria bacterium]